MTRALSLGPSLRAAQRAISKRIDRRFDSPVELFGIDGRYSDGLMLSNKAR